MIYTSYARIAIIVALVSASVATPVAQDQTSLYLEKRAPQGDIEDDDVSDSQQQGRRPSVALMPPGWIRQSTDQNQVSTSSQEKPLPPRLIRQFTSQQPPHQSQESPLSELDDVSDSQPQDRQPKVDRPFPNSSQIESPLASNSDSDMQTEQDYVTSNASQGGIEDDEMFSPGSSTGGSHGTYDTLSKGET
ncbi:hypothetical protein BASA61_010367 [Batrachochytrium salamandrivorans]|nr:hypothetical protein BASA61_010367 [Batrachochytrium salamandrivorans]